ncbi:MAG: hypothetical protein QOH81_556 [Sphingomonadales bacterium]|jgi:hypothetical protein|nr:hypothetical protein [Sphingomonadales bacterium]
MNRWAFVIAAYAIALLATLLLAGWSYAAMRRAERDAEALRGGE